MSIQLSVKIPAKSAIDYPIYIGEGLSSNLTQFIEAYVKSKKAIVVSDDNVASYYATYICNILTSNGYQVKVITFPAGEENKSAINKLTIEEQMFAFGCDRHTVCIALGGGVVGDLVGFTAATYMRGIDFIQIPTSLLAMIDSSVGGKTAVNTSYGKNIIGAFWQPKAVIMDTKFLETLPKEHIANGFFEAIKIFLTFDYEYVVKSDTHINSGLLLNHDLIELIKKAVELKAYVVEVDEQEQNLRMILNFGHTVGHALEKIANYTLLHGFGVGYGMLAEAKIANNLGLLSDRDFLFVSELLAKMNISANYFKNLDTEEIIKAMRGDKKNKDQQINLVLLNGIGSVKNMKNKVAFPVSEDIIKQAINELKV